MDETTTVRRFSNPGDGELLERMYLDFRPRNSFQGLPPLKDEVCVKWVRQMLQTGTSVVAEYSSTTPGPASPSPAHSSRRSMRQASIQPPAS